MPPFLLLNPRAGAGGPDVHRLAAEARRRGIETHLLEPGDDPGAIAAEVDADALGMAGGDGSLAAVAAVAVERDLPFACIPFGTRNHFARDLGLDPSDPLGTLGAFGGRERRVDVGRIGGRMFLNNVSLGLYATLVHRREHHRRRRAALARVRAWLTVLGHRPLELTIDGERVQAHVALVANNAYVFEPPTIGARERLDEGVLHLYVVGGGVEERRGRRFVVDAAGGRLDAAVDGEPESLRTPAEFRVEPCALRVLVPPGG